MALLQSSDLYTVVCRPALPRDTSDVMALTSQIWEGHDYVPHYWQTWLEDPNGLLAVAEYAGHVVGLGKLSQVGDHEWWMQGLRVDPEHQGKGIASHMHHYQLDYWERNYGGVLRLATSSARLPVHHLCERTGFVKVGEYLSYIAPALESNSGGFPPVKMEEVQAALDFVRRSEIFRLSPGLVALDWVWCEPVADHFVAAIQRGEAHWWRAGEKNRGLTIAGIEEEDGDSKTLYIQLAGGELYTLPEMMVEFRGLAGSQGFNLVNWLAPNHEGVIDALTQAGFTRDWEHVLYVYEKRLPA